MDHPTHPGTIVHVRDERWRVAHVDTHARCAVLTLDGLDNTNAQRRLRVIAPFDRPKRARTRARLCADRAAVLQSALATIVHHRPACGLWTPAAASIELLPYQLEPALAVLSGATRILLADDVGLGKTVQAALVVAELRARGWIDRVLIACPPPLRPTWASELARFGITSEIVDAASLVDITARLPPGINPWASRGCAITSLDFLKRPEILSALAEVPIDVLIVDEAHHLTPGTDRGAAIKELAARCPWCIFVSATPHSGDVDAYEFLCRLGDHGDRLGIFRRTRADAGIARRRRVHLARVHARGADVECASAVESYVREMWNGRGAADATVRMVATVIARRAASTPLALERTLTRRLHLLGTDPDIMQPLLPWEDTDDGDDSGAPSLLSLPGLASLSAEAQVLERLIGLARACESGPKIARLLRMLRRIHEPVIVFTEYRDSVDAVIAALPPSIRAGCVTGALTANARLEAIERFNASQLDLLVATDCAGEGLNLHHRCRLIVDLELPWNPLRLEQRIGRVDRLGQRRHVHAVRVCLEGSVEARVLACLKARQQRASSVLPQPVNDMVMAAAVFDGVSLPSGAPLSMSAPIDSNAPIEAGRLERQRAVRAPVGDRVLVTRPQRPYGQALMAIYRISHLTGQGAAVAAQAAAVRIDVRPMPRSLWNAVIHQAAGSPAVIEHVERHARELRVLIKQQRRPLCLGLQSRIEAIRRHIQHHRRTVRVQRSLFDRREEAAADRAATVAAQLDRALAHRLAVVTSPIPADGTMIQPIAIWQVRPGR